MKKNTLLIALFFGLLSTALTAQRTHNGAHNARHFNLQRDGQRSPLVENDTLFGSAFSETCGDMILSYESNNGGYIAGTNGYQDFEKAQRIILGPGSNYVVSEIWAFFSNAAVGNNGPVRAKVYSSTPGGAPEMLLGTSPDVNVADLSASDTSLVPSIFTFSTPPVVSGTEFFISIDVADLYGTQDEVGLWTTEDGCGDGNDAYELWGDGSGWFAFNDGDSWGLNLNLLLGVVVQFDPISSQASEPSASMNGLRIFPATPNPASSDLRISYQLDQRSNVKIELYTTDGKLLQTLDQGVQTPGHFSESMNIAQLPAGSYIYGIVTEKARLMNRFVVER